MKHFLILVLGISFSIACSSQDNSKALQAADTSFFSPNTQEGWQIYNSYAQKKMVDSVYFELIVQHQNNIDWKSSQLIGSIKKSDLFPKSLKIIYYSLLDEKFRITIDIHGRCYLQCQKTPTVNSDLVIYPLKFKYKL